MEVYMLCNLGHCHYLRDEFDRAIENYFTASKRFYDDQNVLVLLYLARAWYQKASKDRSFAALRSKRPSSERWSDCVQSSPGAAKGIGVASSSGGFPPDELDYGPSGFKRSESL
ncbi:hypothetical protein PGT21_018994 [Puccinia graminis f. sp. tritici]|uniref:Uncharacterized protein n=1 Tax=Puccinia graminis f. sp. tritici TaxID=56615 RepID=A0A5B0PK22_PUCGR|nr:hypothetical protein PGT21_018994 [Puccinia graminis f. sp. tritici]